MTVFTLTSRADVFPGLLQDNCGNDKDTVVGGIGMDGGGDPLRRRRQSGDRHAGQGDRVFLVWRPGHHGRRDRGAYFMGFEHSHISAGAANELRISGPQSSGQSQTSFTKKVSAPMVGVGGKQLSRNYGCSKHIKVLMGQRREVCHDGKKHCGCT